MALSADSQRNREVATGNPMADLQGTENSQKPQFDLGLLYRVLSFPLVSFFINFAQKIRTEIEHYHVSISERRVLLVTVDTSLMVLAMVGGNLLWQFTAAGNTLFPSDAQGYGLIATVLVGWWILTAFNDLYDIPSSSDWVVSVFRLAAVGGLGLLVYQITYPLLSAPLPQRFFFYFWVLALLSLVLWRLIYASFSWLLSSPKRVLILGAGKRGQATARLLQQTSSLHYQVLGYISDTPTQPSKGLLGLPVLGQMSDLPYFVQKFAVNEVVVASEHDVTKELFQSLMGCLAQDVQVSSVPDLYERLCRYIPIHYIDPAWALYAVHDQPIFERLRRLCKRLLDLAVVLLVLPVLSLLFPLLALAVRFSSPGPIFYQQVRSGRGGKPFSIYKFRTMVVDAEKDGKPRWATENDPRITRVGRFLRKTRLDELPQIINILKGEMSLVGPRPERPEFVEELKRVVPFYEVRLMVKPGLTGWAQIHYTYGNSVEDALLKLQYDFYYIRYWSLWLDLYTLFKTVYVVFKFKGL